MVNASCGVLVDRHVPKTAGTTVRTMLRANAAAGACEYIGYDVGRTWQSRVGFTHRRLTDVVEELRSPSAVEQRRRLCIEAHQVGGSFWADIATLRSASAFIRSCPVVVMLRVREPFSWYRSYYDWAVLARQRTEDPQVWGANFTDWLPPNMQCRFLLHGTRGQSSEWANTMATKPAQAAHHQTIGAKRWADLERVVAAADIVAPLDRLDDAMRAALVLTGGFLTTASYTSIKPPERHGPWDRLPRRARVQRADVFCSPGEARRRCIAAVQEVAPDDFRLYSLAVRRFAALWKEVGIAAGAAWTATPHDIATGKGSTGDRAAGRRRQRRPRSRVSIGRPT